MKRSSRRFPPFFAVLLLSLFLLIACDGTNAPQETSGSATSSDAVSSDAVSSDGLPTEAPEASDVDPDGETTVAEPEGTAEKVTAETTARPAEPTDAPDDSTVKEPETTAREPETTAKPATTTKAPETTVRPAVTTKAPETTAKEPETTVKEPETTAPVAPRDPEPSDNIPPKGTVKVTMDEIFKISDHTDANSVHCRVVQGGCSDGTYYYVGLNNGNKTSKSVTAVLKYEIAWPHNLVAVYEDLRVAHCNDMEYLPETNEILFVHNEPERWLVSIYDADTMQKKRTVTLGNGAIEIYSLTYDPYEQCYWAGLSYGFNFIKLDLNFEQVGDIYVGKNTGYTKQGMTCDSKYIYFLQYKSNSIIVYNKAGEFVREILLPKTSYEAENIFWIGDVFYVGYYKSKAGGMLYKTTIESLTEYDTEITAEDTPYAILPQFTGADGSFYKVAQGSCTDGTYLYAMLNDDNKDANPGHCSALHKIDLRTGAVVQIVEGFAAGSSNDMTYNPKTKEIVVATDNPDKYRLVVIDAATLTVKREVTLSTKVFAIAYDEAQNGYWLALAGTYDYMFVDANFQKVGSTFAGYNTGYTKQAMDFDGEYLYFLQSKSNAVAIYKKDGTFVGVAALPTFKATVGGEVKEVTSAQSICHVGDTFYIGCYFDSVGYVLYEAEISIVH